MLETSPGYSKSTTLRNRFITNFYSLIAPGMIEQGEWRNRPLSLLARANPHEGLKTDVAHLVKIEDAIIAAVDGTGNKRIIVNMPPQHGKSKTISHATPVWYLENFPNKFVQLASYQADYAQTYSMLVRDTLERNPALFATQPRHDSRARSIWYTQRGGGMAAQGLHGSFTGRRGDFVIVDDPIKNTAVANSPTERQKIWDWYESTIESRLNPDSVLIIVMTRWHEDDLVGRILARDGDDAWEVLRFPAIAEGEDILGRAEGDPLWADMYPLEWWETLPSRKNPVVWNGLYQQRPTQPSGAIVKRKWFAGKRNRYDWHTRFDVTQGRYISIDTAEGNDDDDKKKKNQTSAFNVALVAEWTHNKKLRTTHVDRKRMEPADLEKWVRDLIDEWDFDGKLKGIIIEKKSTGVTLISTLKRVLPSRYRRLVFIFSPKDSKDARLDRASMWMANDCYELPAVSGGDDDPDWLGDYEAELFGAPFSKYRDQADATAQIIIYLESYIEQGYNERNKRNSGGYIKIP